MIAIVAAVLALYLAYLTIETVLHRSNRSRVPHRIHVNGTRGKSSVTRLIAAGLRAGGIRTVAKTTGTLPRLIDETGAEHEIRRMGPANLIEQAEVFAWARRRRTEAIVIECMAVHPQLQAAAERQFVRATVAVITNARPDHLDVMGPTVADVARSLTQTVPRGGILFTAEQQAPLRAIFAAACRGRASRFVAVPQPRDSEDLLAGFRHIEHAENVALALEVCAHLGVPRGIALQGMWAAMPDPGALRITERRFAGKRLRLVNALAANDPASTLAIWERIVQEDARDASTNDERRIVLVNTRRDRQHRSLQLADLLPALSAEAYVVTGGADVAVVRRACELGLPAERLFHLGDASVDEVLRELCRHAGERALVFAMGNVAGNGLELAASFDDEAEESARGL